MSKKKTPIHEFKEPDALGADWDKSGTIRELETAFNIMLNGPGWYKFKIDTLLVIPLERDEETRWHQKTGPKERFIVYVYNGRDPQTLFGSIASAPTRTY